MFINFKKYIVDLHLTPQQTCSQIKNVYYQESHRYYVSFGDNSNLSHFLPKFDIFELAALTPPGGVNYRAEGSPLIWTCETKKRS